MRIALLTPTYGPDLARFALLRQSLEAAGCALPHIVVVQSEDLPAFERHGFGQNVQLMASSTVLPPEVEQLRLRVHARAEPLRKLRRSLNKHCGWFADACYDGWHVQQIIKLIVPAWPQFDAVVTLDSDVIITGQLRVEDIVRGAEVALHCTPGDAAWKPHWNHAANRVLGIDVRRTGIWNCVAHPFVFSSAATAALHRHLEQRHQRPWWQALLAQPAGDLSEFTLYGTFVREVLGMQGQFEVPANGRTRWVYTAEDRKEVSALIDKSFSDPAVDYLVLQASRRWPVKPYEAALQSAFARRLSATQ